MTDEKQPRTDAKWSPAAKALWKSTLAGFVLEPHHVELLRGACCQLSRAAEARKAIDADGVVVLDRFGQKREHPGLAVERQAHLAYLRLLRELGLDVAPSESRGPRRPGTRG